MRSFTSKTVSDEMRLAFMAFAPALPRPSDMAQPKIVDIGAGLAMYHPYLHAYFGNLSSHYIADKTVAKQDDRASARKADNIYLKHAGGFQDASKFSFYSSLECATDIARESGFAMSKWHTIEASSPNLEALKSVDIVMSILSWTYHYKVNTYIDAVKKILKPRTGRLILTPRTGKLKDGTVLRNNEDLVEAGLICAASDVSAKKAYARLNAKQRKIFASGSGWFPVVTVCCIECSSNELLAGFQEPPEWSLLSKR